MVRKIIKTILFNNGYEIHRIKKNKPLIPFEQPTNNDTTFINVGAGDWEKTGWVNLDYSTDWYAKLQNRHPFIQYDIRNDILPFDNGSINLIYCSHVIEHIEDKYILNFFKDTFRVLKKGGGIRICCPDASFLYTITKSNIDFWKWRLEWFSNSLMYNGDKPRNVDFLVREIATPKLLNYINGVNKIDYIDAFKELPRDDFFQFLTNDLEFRPNYPGDHINYWTIEKLLFFLKNAGFSNIIPSKWSASNFTEMQDTNYFDIVYPNMSLYIEAIK